MLNNINKYYVKYVCISLLSLFVGVAIGYYYPHPLTSLRSEVWKSDKVLDEQVQYKAVKEYVYVPKQSSEKTDVQILDEQPVVNVEINGNPYEFKLDQYELQKFDKGKLVVTQTGEIKIKIDNKIDNRKWNLKLGKSNHGIAGGIDYQIGHVIGVWTYVDSDTIAGGISGKL